MRYDQPAYGHTAPIRYRGRQRIFEVLVGFLALVGMIPPAWMLVDFVIR